MENIITGKITYHLTAGQLKAKIDKYQLNNKMLADKIGIGAGTFSEKLRELRGNKFTEPQIKTLSEFIIEIGEGLLK